MSQAWIIIDDPNPKVNMPPYQWEAYLDNLTRQHQYGQVTIDIDIEHEVLETTIHKKNGKAKKESKITRTIARRSGGDSSSN